MQAQNASSTVHLAAYLAYRAGKLPQSTCRIGIVQVIHERRRHPQRSFRQRFCEHAVHLVGYLVGTLPGHLGRDGVFLLVGVIHDVGMLCIARIERHHVAAETLGNDHRCIVPTRLGTVNGIFFIGEHPVHLVVFAKGRHHLVADVHPQGNKLALVPLIGICHGHL